MGDFEALMEEALMGEQPDFVGGVTAPIDSDEATRWLARKEAAQKRLADLDKAYQAAVDRLTDARDRAAAPIEQQIEEMSEALIMYHQVMMALDEEGNKTITLPTGVLKSGTWGGDKWVKDDTFDAWAFKNLPGAIKTVEPSIGWAEAKKLIKESALVDDDGKVCVDNDGHPLLADGKPVPGIVIQPAVRQFEPKTHFEIEQEKAKKVKAPKAAPPEIEA